MIDPRNQDDRLEIGPLGIFALMELMDKGDSDVFEEWLKKEESDGETKEIISKHGGGPIGDSGLQVSAGDCL